MAVHRHLSTLCVSIKSVWAEYLHVHAIDLICADGDAAHAAHAAQSGTFGSQPVFDSKAVSQSSWGPINARSIGSSMTVRKRGIS
jgi:hypothetical protein